MSNQSKYLQLNSLADSSVPALDLALERELAVLLVEALALEVEPDAIAPLDPLYDGPLGLDSIDILEIALCVSKRYEVQVRAGATENRVFREDDPNRHEIFASLRSLANYLKLHLHV